MPQSTERPTHSRHPDSADDARQAAPVPNPPATATGPAVSSAGSGDASSTGGARKPAARGTHDGHGLVAVGPGRAGSWLVQGGYVMNPLPIQPAKIHSPPARNDVLSRGRLNSWLESAAGGRLALIIADAGFGKTTLLGDWARHTRRLVLWYRLEPDDRDWLTFVRHLVASGRELHPGFAPDTYAMLIALGSGGPTRTDIVAAIARELADFAATSERGVTLILDDYHLVDGSPETEPIVRSLLDRTGPRFSLVIASRSMPTLPVGRLRARGAIATLTGRDLCFDVAETSSLFRDAYHHPLDEDVASDLCERTEGWAALLMLVKARLAEGSDPRLLVASLVATHGDIYDFLAEELFANLPAALTEFLMHCAVLLEIDGASATLATGRSFDASMTTIEEAERLGLLVRPDQRSGHRFHPLVREFLVARLTREVGAAAVRELHRSIAAGYQGASWHTRAWHLLEAGDVDACQSTVDGALEQILASGEFEQAKRFLAPRAGDARRPAALFLRSKIALVHGDYHRALNLARRAVAAGAGTDVEGLCLLNLAAALGMCGIADEAEAISRRALECHLSDSQRYVAKATLALTQASQVGDLRQISDELDLLAHEQEAADLRRYAAISRLKSGGSPPLDRGGRRSTSSRNKGGDLARWRIDRLGRTGVGVGYHRRRLGTAWAARRGPGSIVACGRCRNDTGYRRSCAGDGPLGARIRIHRPSSGCLDVVRSCAAFEQPPRPLQPAGR